MGAIIVFSCALGPLQCPPLPAIVNGTVNVTGTSVGDIATYACAHGFNLVGHSTRKCGANFEWTNSNPSCEGSIYLPCDQA